MIKDIGNEIQKLKVQAGFHFSIDRTIALVIFDTNKLRAIKDSDIKLESATPAVDQPDGEVDRR